MIKQSQILQQTQKLTPQQVQLIRMLELPVIELEEKIKKEIEENPTLEDCGKQEDANNDNGTSDEKDEDNSFRENEIDLGDYRNEDEIPDYRLQESARMQQVKQPEYSYSKSSSFTEFLTEQLSLKEMTPEIGKCSEYIIGNLDNNGYLSRDLVAISDDLAFSEGMEYTPEQMEDALFIVQELDPAGVGARSLQECLTLQLERKKATPVTQMAYQILTEDFDTFAKRHFDKIQKKYSITPEMLKDVMAEILSLNPKPGASWSDLMEDKMEQIVPDFIIENFDGDLIVSLNNNNIPELRVSEYYTNQLEDWVSNKENRTASVKNAIMFVKHKIDSAKWFIDSIKQRNNTLLTTMQVIADIQKSFFLTGDDVSLKPMILKDVAEKTGFDISTISRVSNSKYVMTDFGVFSLKYFFSESSVTEDGEEVSKKEIKKILSDIINSEDKNVPYSDDKLSELLKQKGYIVARRTVAKYREQLGFAVARLRKEL